MNFYASRLFRCRRCRLAWARILLSAFDGMTDDEWYSFVGTQMKRYRHPALLGLRKILRDASDMIVPVGFLHGASTESGYVSATIEALIEMAAGSKSPKFSMPLSMILDAARATRAKQSLASPIDLLRHAMLSIICVRLAGQHLRNRINRHLANAGTIPIGAPDVVFCVRGRKPAAEAASTRENMEPWNSTYDQAAAGLDIRDTALQQ